MVPIDISVKLVIVENIHIGPCTDTEFNTYKALFQEFRDVFSWSYEEIPGIDPSIVVHEIKTYPDAKPVWQRLRQIHPRKATAIKSEVEKLLKAGFIYPIPLTDWVLNIVLVTKKQGTIRICIDYRDINRACPKDNYPMPYIDQIIDDCATVKFSPLWMAFPVIIKLTFYLQINQKRHSSVHEGHFLIASYLLD